MISQSRKRIFGFSLLELLITVSIIAIIAGIAYPSYLSHVAKTRRTDGESALLDLAARMERYYYQNNSYVGATLANLGTVAASPQGWYTLSITAQTATTFAISATPMGAQLTYDTRCGSLTYNQLGTKSQTGAGTTIECWGS